MPRYLHCKDMLENKKKSQISISYLMTICARNVDPAEHEINFDSVCSGIGPSHQETEQAMKKQKGNNITKCILDDPAK